MLVGDDTRKLAERQYKMARGFPSNEYVVLVGENVHIHTPDETEADEAYYKALKERVEGGDFPVYIPPDLRKSPGHFVIRTRTLPDRLD